MNFNLDQFKPQEKGKTDKYSWNMYRFLRKYKAKGVEVFLGDGAVILAPKNAQCDCHPGIVNGAKPDSIRAGKFQEWAFQHKNPRVEITEEFFARYADEGIAYLDALQRTKRGDQ